MRLECLMLSLDTMLERLLAEFEPLLFLDLLSDDFEAFFACLDLNVGSWLLALR
jgi:hypothetical protein